MFLTISRICASSNFPIQDISAKNFAKNLQYLGNFSVTSLAISRQKVVIMWNDIQRVPGTRKNHCEVHNFLLSLCSSPQTYLFHKGLFYQTYIVIKNVWSLKKNHFEENQSLNYFLPLYVVIKIHHFQTALYWIQSLQHRKIISLCSENINSSAHYNQGVFCSKKCLLICTRNASSMSILWCVCWREGQLNIDKGRAAIWSSRGLQWRTNVSEDGGDGIIKVMCLALRRPAIAGCPYVRLKGHLLTPLQTNIYTSEEYWMRFA